MGSPENSDLIDRLRDPKTEGACWCCQAAADEIEHLTAERVTVKEIYAWFAKTTQANERNHDSLIAIREFLFEEKFDAAREAWDEVSHEDQRAIWVATSKGGWFTTKERHLMKTWEL